LTTVDESKDQSSLFDECIDDIRIARPCDSPPCETKEEEGEEEDTSWTCFFFTQPSRTRLSTKIIPDRRIVLMK